MHARSALLPAHLASRHRGGAAWATTTCPQPPPAQQAASEQAPVAEQPAIATSVLVLLNAMQASLDQHSQQIQQTQQQMQLMQQQQAQPQQERPQPAAHQGDTSSSLVPPSGSGTAPAILANNPNLTHTGSVTVITGSNGNGSGVNNNSNSSINSNSPNTSHNPFDTETAQMATAAQQR